MASPQEDKIVQNYKKQILALVPGYQRDLAELLLNGLENHVSIKTAETAVKNMKTVLDGVVQQNLTSVKRTRQEDSIEQAFQTIRKGFEPPAPYEKVDLSEQACQTKIP
jgi:hypothetical protein